MAKRDPSRTVSIHGDKYNYDPDKNKWMSGKKEATPATAAMLDMFLEQLSPDSDDEVETFVGTANITPQATADEESPEAVRDKEEAHERKQEAQEDMEAPPPPAEAEAEAEQVKPPPLDPTSLKPPAPEPEAPTPEPTPVAPEPTPLERRAGTLKDEYTERLRERLAKRMPLLRLFTDKLEDPKKAPQATRAADQIKPTPVEADQLKPATEQADSAPPQATTPQAVITDQVNSAPPQAATTEQADATTAPSAAEPEPVREQTPFERRFGRLKDEYTERFAERIKKRMPLARLFTDRLEDPKSAAKKESAPRETPAAKGISGFSKEATDALKSIDKSIKEILGLFKDNKKEQKQDQTRETTEEQKQEIKTEAVKREQAVDNLEQRGSADRPETMLRSPDTISSETMLRSPDPISSDQQDAVEEPDSNSDSGGGLGQQIKQYATNKVIGGLRSRGKRLFSGIKSKLGFGAAAGAAAGVAGVATREPNIAAEITSTGNTRYRNTTTGRFASQTAGKESVEAVEKVVARESAETGGKIVSKQGAKAAEKVGAKTAGRSLLKKIPGVGLLAGLAFGAGRLMRGDFLGAAGEVGSGLASTVPGIGTAASVGIDAGLAARDIYRSGDAEKEPKEYADGGIVNNPKPIKFFAKGGIVDSPTAFSHDGGTGVMGEAGPEAIMPLERGSDGKLGVKAQPAAERIESGSQIVNSKQTGAEGTSRNAASVDYVKSTNVDTGETDSLATYRTEGKSRTRGEFEEYLKKNPEVAEKVKKSGIMDQTKNLKDVEQERRNRAEEREKKKNEAASPTIINNSTTNNNQSGGSGGGSVATAGPRNSLDLNYYAQ